MLTFPILPIHSFSAFGTVWCGVDVLFYFISFCFIIPLELEKSKWVAVCAFCVLFYALFSFRLVLSFTFAFTVLLPVDAKAYAYPTFVNSHISFFFLTQFARVSSLSLTYIPSGGFPTCSISFFFHPLSSSGFSFPRGQFRRRLVSSHPTSFLLSMVVWLF